MDWNYVATIQEVMEEDEDEEMQEEEEEEEEEMSESGYIGPIGPIVRTSLDWIQWIHKQTPAWVCETYLDMNRETNEEMDRMVGELIVLKKYMGNVEAEIMRLRLSGPGPKEHKKEVEKSKREVGTFQEKAPLLAQGNVDLCDSVDHLAQMVMTWSPKTVGKDKAFQSEPMVTEKKVQNVSPRYADVLSQTEKEAEKEEANRGTDTTDDEEMIDAAVTKQINLRPAVRPSAESPTNNIATGRTARALVVYGVACLGPMVA